MECEDGDDEGRRKKGEGEGEGERVLAATRRPDGSMRKPIRIRAGYTPQDEVAIYQSKGALFKKGQPEVPPGYDPSQDLSQKPKTKAAKKNQKRKEKKHQVEAASSGVNGGKFESVGSNETNYSSSKEEIIDSVTQQIGALLVKSNELTIETDGNPKGADMEKRIRALRKKIRETEILKDSLESKGSLNAEQAMKLSRLDIWRKELDEMEKQL